MTVIDGKALAETILKQLTEKIRENQLHPTMAVILVGDDPGSASYVRQKEKAARQIGATLVISRQPSDVSPQLIRQSIETYNRDPHIHGIIIQRPLPTQLQEDTLLHLVSPAKDIDGFVPDSHFDVPVALACIKILQKVSGKTDKKFAQWLQNRQTVVVGRGETAGRPIAQFLKKHGSTPVVIHSQTRPSDKNSALQDADIVISCVGKKDVITNDVVKPGVILISVGIWRDESGKLHGDYEEDTIKDIASYYTPTPGGIGPVNVACLMQNLIKAAEAS